MKDLLLLVHRIPYPPNKGDKIRSYHMLKALSETFRVHLGTFIDDPDDWQYTGDVETFCESAHFERIRPTVAKLRCLSGFLSGLPLSVPFYSNRKMRNWVDETIRRNKIDRIMVFSSAMAQYVDSNFPGYQLVDFVDVDSDKWRQYAEGKSWPGSWIYQREAERLLEFDRRVAEHADLSILVSAKEAELFRSLVPDRAQTITHINNGVDTEYFTPGVECDNPYPLDREILVFTGAMDYWANVDAVKWFVNEVFPVVRQHNPKVLFYIVGSNPSEEVRSLEDHTGVKVTGKVPDMRPYLKYARVAVTCLRIARGIQNKVLEAMAMGKAVVTTPAAIEGICGRQSTHEEDLDIFTESTPEGFAEAVINVLRSNDGFPISEKNREFVLLNYGWDSNMQILEEYLDPV